MTLQTRYGFVVAIILLFLVTPRLQSATFDPKSLDEKISVDLRSVSMSDAIAMVSNAADAWIVAPGEPESGIIMTLSDRTVREILDGLAAATGTTWSIRDDMIVYVNPPVPEKPKKPAKRTEPLTPEQGMAEMIASLNPSQLYALSSGYPMGYVEMSENQQDIMKNMLAAPTVAVSDAGEISSTLPDPRQTTLSFITMPYLTVPDSTGQGTATVRLDSTRYMSLKRNVK